MTLGKPCQPVCKDIFWKKKTDTDRQLLNDISDPISTPLTCLYRQFQEGRQIISELQCLFKATAGIASGSDKFLPLYSTQRCDLRANESENLEEIFEIQKQRTTQARNKRIYTRIFTSFFSKDHLN